MGLCASKSTSDTGAGEFTAVGASATTPARAPTAAPTRAPAAGAAGVAAAANNSAEQKEAVTVLCEALKDKGMTTAMAEGLMARAVAVDRDVVRLTATAAAAADAKNYAAEAAAEAELKSLMSSPQRWVEVDLSADPKALSPPRLAAAFGCDMTIERATAAARGWALRALLALRMSPKVKANPSGVASDSASGAAGVAVDDSVVALDRACIPQANGAAALLPLIASEGSFHMLTALLDLPRAYGVDLNVVGSNGCPAVQWAVCRARPFDYADAVEAACAVRLLHGATAAALNANGVGDVPLLHALLRTASQRLYINGSVGQSATLLNACCSERVCPSDGSGLDPLTPATADPDRPPVSTAAHIVAIEGFAREFSSDELHALCGIVRDACARVTAYAQGFEAALTGAVAACELETVLSAPVLAVVTGYALKRSPYASQWPATN